MPKVKITASPKVGTLAFEHEGDLVVLADGMDDSAGAVAALKGPRQGPDEKVVNILGEVKADKKHQHERREAIEKPRAQFDQMIEKRHLPLGAVIFRGFVCPVVHDGTSGFLSDVC